MKISVDDKELYTLSETKKRVLMNDISSEIFESDMKRRLQWVLMHKWENCFKALKEEWEPKLKASGVKSFPANEDEFALMVFAHPDYQDRAARDKQVSDSL